jgi:hypothetical protein
MARSTQAQDEQQIDRIRRHRVILALILPMTDCFSLLFSSYFSTWNVGFRQEGSREFVDDRDSLCRVGHRNSFGKLDSDVP